MDAQTITLRVSPPSVYCPECRSLLVFVTGDDKRLVFKHDDPHSYRECPHRAKLLAITVQHVEATVI